MISSQYGICNVRKKYKLPLALLFGGAAAAGLYFTFIEKPRTHVNELRFVFDNGSKHFEYNAIETTTFGCRHIYELRTRTGNVVVDTIMHSNEEQRHLTKKDNPEIIKQRNGLWYQRFEDNFDRLTRIITADPHHYEWRYSVLHKMSCH